MKNNLLYAAAAAALVLTSCKEAYDLDERLPDDFGTTLYSYLEEHGYQNVKKLVDELGYAEALQGRSLKTMFVANDEAYERFYANNQWGVKCYEDLSLSQKKQLLYSSMLDNSLQIMNLSNTTSNTGVVTGNAMRRMTALSVFDSVPVITPAEMPDGNKYWARFKEGDGRSIVCMRDMTTAPLTFFTEPFLVQNRITNDDINFIYNYTIDRQPGDAGVAGIDVVGPNIRCANGFIHRMAEVIVPQENMAEVIRTTSDLSQWSKFVERFSAPYYLGRTVTDAFNFENGTEVDSLFQKRYLSERSQDGAPLIAAPDDQVYALTEVLKFDPGWNAYFSSDPNSTTTNTVAMQKNMGVMLVPDNAALEDYWNNGTGRVLRDYYGSWEKVPDAVLVKLLRNNMLNSFVGSVPSKFDDIMNSTQDPMGIKPEDVSRVQLACNGAIYVTNKVFSPTEYVSVSFPALVNETMSIINWAIYKLEYHPYLNSINSYYSFLIPTNEALEHYVDPYSWGSATKQCWHFHYKADATSNDERVWAEVFEYDPETDTEGACLFEKVTGPEVTKRLKDVLNNHIIVGNIESGREYYASKNGNVVRVVRENGQVTGVMGTFQSADMGERIIPVAKVYDQSVEGNGKSYILESEPVLTTKNTAVDVIAASGETIFLELLMGSDIYGNGGLQSAGTITSFNNFNYTVYLPTDAAMAEYMACGDIKTWTEIDAMEENEMYTAADIERERKKTNNFVRYHVQDNTVYLGQEFFADGAIKPLDRYYETAAMNDDPDVLKFYTIHVQSQGDDLLVTDALGHERHIVKEDGCYNLPARELQSNSFAVVHKIDKPLFFDPAMCKNYDKK